MKISCLITLLLLQLATSAQDRQLIIPTGHAAPIVKLAFSPDGSMLASVSSDGDVKIFDTHQFVQVGNFRQESSETQSLFFDSTGQYVYSWCKSSFIKFDVRSNKLVNNGYFSSSALKTSLIINNDYALIFDGSSFSLMDLNKNTVKPLNNPSSKPLVATSDYDQISGEFVGVDIEGNLIRYKVNTGVCPYLNTEILRKHFIPRNHFAQIFHPKIFKLKWTAKTISLSPDGRYLGVIGDNRFIKFFDTKKHKSSARSEASTAGNLSVYNLFFYDSLPVVGMGDGEIALWTMKSFRQLKTLNEHYGDVLSLAQNRAADMMASAGSDRSIVLWKLSKFKPIARIYGLSPQINCASYVRKKNLVLTGDITGEMRSVGYKEFLSPAMKNIFIDREVAGLQLSYDQKYLLIKSSPYKNSTLYGNQYVYLIQNLETNEIVYRTRSKRDCYFDIEGYLIKEIDRRKKTRYFELYETKISKKLKKRISKPFAYESKFNYIPDIDVTHPIEISVDTEGALKLIPEGTENEIQYIPIEDNDYVYKTKEGYYYGTNTALKTLKFNQNGKIYAFDQFDLQYNRPDIVLQQLGTKDSVLINSYYRAYQKRLKKMHYTEDMFSSSYYVPELKILHKDTLPTITNHPSLKVGFAAIDSMNKLDRINVYVNDVPIYGINGVDLRSKNIQHLESSVQILLSDGLNKIDISCQNDKSVESFKETFTITYQPPKLTEPKTYFIGIGVSHYKDNRYNLNYPVKDISDLVASLKSSVKNLVIDTLFNEKVTRNNILKLKQKLLAANINDKVILSLSGHGLLSDSLDFYYGTYDVVFAHPEINGLAYDDLENLLDSIPPRKKLLLMDACHSGEVDKDVHAGRSVASATANKNDLPKGVVKRGLSFTLDSTNSRIGLQNSYKLMKDLFADLNRGNGASVISAAAGDEFAFESSKWGKKGNGVFTYSILQVLKQQKEITISQLKSLVSAQVEQLTHGAQTPTSRQENMDFDWRIK